MTRLSLQFKQKDKAGRPDIDAVEAVMTREDRTNGFFRKSGKIIVDFAVREILGEEIARKLA